MGRLKTGIEKLRKRGCDHEHDDFLREATEVIRVELESHLRAGHEISMHSLIDGGVVVFQCRQCDSDHSKLGTVLEICRSHLADGVHDVSH